MSEPAVAVDRLHKTYKSTEALRGLSFSIPVGRVTGFLGPNGAGKTTTFRSLLGLTKPDSGDVRVLGLKVPEHLSEITKRVGCIVEEPGLITAHTGRINLRIAANTLGFGHDRIDEMLEFVGLTNDAERRAGEYSKGMRQRLALAAAMLGDPELLLLDEPLDGLDPAGQRVFRSRLRSLADSGRTVVVSSHDLGDVEALADHVVVVDQGRLVTQGSLEDLLGFPATRVVVARRDLALQALASSGIEASVDEPGLLVDSDDGALIIKTLTDAGIYPSEVKEARSSLESVFLGMTGGGDV